MTALEEYHEQINLIINRLQKMKIEEVTLDVLRSNNQEVRKFNKEIFKLLKLLGNVHDEYTLMLQELRWGVEEK